MPTHLFELTDMNEPILATAIHAGHDMSPFLSSRCRLTDAERLYEEDPHTDRWACGYPNHVCVTRSRFDLDLNRPLEKAVYLSPDDAWGLDVWDSPPTDSALSRLRLRYAEFHEELAEAVDALLDVHHRLFVVDIHSYNHRRAGRLAPQHENPEVNIGTGTLSDRGPWAVEIDHAMAAMRTVTIDGRLLDVRENVKFRGGHMAQWLHERYPGSVCALSIEVKKIFMDEHSGVTDPERMDAIAAMFQALRQALLSGSTPRKIAS